MLHYQFRPLEKWPGELTKNRKRSQFRTSWPTTLNDLEYELAHLKSREVVLQAAVRSCDIRNDGMLRADARPSHPGVILSFESKHGPLSYPCDRFTEWQANVRAIALSLQALRAVDRYGVTRRAEQYRGWEKIEGPANSKPTNLSVGEAAAILCRFGGHVESVDIMTSRDAAASAYRAACLATHPDRYPDRVADYKRVQDAMAVIELLFSKGVA